MVFLDSIIYLLSQLAQQQLVIPKQQRVQTPTTAALGTTRVQQIAVSTPPMNLNNKKENRCESLELAKKVTRESTVMIKDLYKDVQLTLRKYDDILKESKSNKQKTETGKQSPDYDRLLGQLQDQQSILMLLLQNSNLQQEMIGIRYLYYLLIIIQQFYIILYYYSYYIFCRRSNSQHPMIESGWFEKNENFLNTVKKSKERLQQDVPPKIVEKGQQQQPSKPLSQWSNNKVQKKMRKDESSKTFKTPEKHERKPTGPVFASKLSQSQKKLNIGSLKQQQQKHQKQQSQVVIEKEISSIGMSPQRDRDFLQLLENHSQSQDSEKTLRQQQGQQYAGKSYAMIHSKKHNFPR